MAGLWPRRYTKDIYWSVNDLTADLRGLKIAVYPFVGKEQENHDKCKEKVE